MDAFKSGFQSEERFNESGDDNDFVLVVWAFCLTPGTSPSVICPLIHGRCCVIVWEMKKPFWSKRRFERSRLFCSVAPVVEASPGSPEVKGIMITLQPRRSFDGLHIPPLPWPLHEESPFWLMMKLDRSADEHECFVKRGVSLLFRFILTRWRSSFLFFLLESFSDSWQGFLDSCGKCGLKHFFTPEIESHRWARGLDGQARWHQQDICLLQQGTSKVTNTSSNKKYSDLVLK